MTSVIPILVKLASGTETLPYVEHHTFYKMHTATDAIYLKDEDMQTLYENTPGQIIQGSSFGDCLFELAKSSDTNHWVEIGSWNGLGSTTCILNGFKESGATDKHLISYELDPVMYNVAKRNLATHACINQVTFVHDKLIGDFSSIGIEMFPSESELPDSEKGPHFYMHYQKEKHLFAKSVGSKPPYAPDVVLLDGGEYSGYNDWLQLDKSNLKYICIDDAFTYKSRKIVSEIEQEGKFQKMHSGSDRNGWVVFQKL